MDIDEARSFLREHHRGVLATRRASGGPQMSPIMVGVDGDGLVAISTRETARKVRNIRRDPRVSLCVLSDDFWKWIQVDGTATVVSLPDAMEPLVAHYRSLAGEHPDWDDYRRAMHDERRVIVRIDIERAGPDQHG
jgi:PPOX class probable F420-dependent enzyme